MEVLKGKILTNFITFFNTLSYTMTAVLQKPNRKGPTYRNEDIEEIFERRELRNEFLHHLAKGLEDGVVINTGQVEAESHSDN